jgi:nitrogen regulatory protein P-II 1
MKHVWAIIQPHKLSDVSLVLRRMPGVSGMTVTDARGWGRGKRQDEASHRDEARDFEAHVRVDVTCTAGIAEDVATAIQRAAHTGFRGDGVVYISPIEDAIRISTGERGDPAC